MTNRSYDMFNGIDFSDFEPVSRSYEKNAVRKIEQTPRKVSQPKKPQLRVVRNPVKSAPQEKREMRRTALQTAKVIAVAVLLLTMLSTLLYGRFKVDELDREISNLTAEITAAQSENVRLNMKLDSVISLKNVEDYAQTRLGMVKMENHQIEYIDLSGEDKVVLSGTKSLSVDNKSFASKLLEYISK